MKHIVRMPETSFLKITILGSGSAGNCALLETSKISILVDAGFSAKQITQRLESIGRSIDQIQAILLTHEHIDHTMGLSVLAGRKNLPVYCNRLTSECLAPKLKNYKNWRLFRTGETFSLEDLIVETFPIPHDAYDPVGFAIHHGLETICFLTDLGHAPTQVLERVRQATVLLLETNYDADLLREDSKRPWSVKQRIMARHGHLSNTAAAEVAAGIASSRLRHIYLSHLSQDCNRPDLARKAVSSALAGAGVTHVTLHDTAQKVPTPTLDFFPHECQSRSEIAAL